jgi:serine/threonine protein kinase
VYLAPELLSDSGFYSYQSDFWALGCLLVEMASGKPPYAGDNTAEIKQAISKQDTPQMKGLSPEFNQFLRMMLQKDPVGRATWDDVRKHAWWSTPVVEKPVGQVAAAGGNAHFDFNKLLHQTYSFTKRLYLPQPQFDKAAANSKAKALARKESKAELGGVAADE